MDASPNLNPRRAEATPAGQNRRPTVILTYLLGALTTLIVVGAAQWLTHKPDPPPLALHAPPTAAPTDTPAPSPTPLPTATPLPITVFVSGAVMQPGLYQLPAEARLGDAIQIAGGVTAEAAAGLINQAEKLWDGAHVRIPTVSEAATTPPISVGQAGGQPPGTDASRNGGTGLPASGVLININSATLAQLDSLPGIGPSKAQAIIDNRPYNSVDDLERVPGIGANTITQLRDLVTAQ
jgi:competence protein ComEA